MWSRIMLHMQMHRDKLNRHRHLDNTSIRIEISPAEEETENWTMADWRQLADEFFAGQSGKAERVREFDAQYFKRKDGRKEDGHTHLANTQYVVSLHRDSKSGILHLHINANRVDMEGNVNNSYMIGQRAVDAANKIAERRGWIQAMTKREWNIDEIHEACLDVLRNMDSFDWHTYEAMLKAKGYDVMLKRSNSNKVVGYSVKKGNSVYKSSELGHGRDLMPSKIEQTWAKLHQEKNVNTSTTSNSSSTSSIFGVGPDDFIPSAKAKVPQPNGAIASHPTRPTAASVQMPVKTKEPKPAMVHHDIDVDDKTYSFDIPKEANDIIMDCIKLPDDVLWSTIVDVQNTALLMFVNYLDAATIISENCGGGGGSATESGWGRKDDEDDREWARRCAQQAGIMHVRRPRGYRR